MPNAQLGEQRVDRADLDTCSATLFPELGRCDVVLAIRLQQRKRCEALDDLLARLWPRESLKQFLENHSRRDDDIGAHERVFELLNFRLSARSIAAQGKRPDARVYEQRHDLERSAL